MVLFSELPNRHDQFNRQMVATTQSTAAPNLIKDTQKSSSDFNTSKAGDATNREHQRPCKICDYDV